MKVTLENFDKLDGFSPKSIFTFITRKVIVVTEALSEDKTIVFQKVKLNRFDTIEFYRDKNGMTFTYLWNGFNFKRIENR